MLHQGEVAGTGISGRTGTYIRDNEARIASCAERTLELYYIDRSRSFNKRVTKRAMFWNDAQIDVLDVYSL